MRMPGARARVGRGVTDLIVRMARENSFWGYDRIVGALANVGHVVSDQTVANVLSSLRHRNRVKAEPEQTVHRHAYGRNSLRTVSSTGRSVSILVFGSKQPL